MSTGWRGTLRAPRRASYAPVLRAGEVAEYARPWRVLLSGLVWFGALLGGALVWWVATP